MNFLEYLRQHPDRINNLLHTEEFFAKEKLNPIYVSSDSELIDITTMASFIKLHQGSKLDDEFTAMYNYLKNDSLFSHPEDSATEFMARVEEIKEEHKAKLASPAETGSVTPFFVRPETALFFMRHHLKESPQLYGHPFTERSSLLSRFARNTMVKAMNKLKDDNFTAYYLATNDIQVKVQAMYTESDEGRSYYLDVTLNFKSYLKHERISIDKLPDGGFKVPTIGEILNIEEVNAHLPKGAEAELVFT